MWSAYANGELACLAMFHAALTLSTSQRIDTKVLIRSIQSLSYLKFLSLRKFPGDFTVLNWMIRLWANYGQIKEKALFVPYKGKRLGQTR